MVKKGQPKRDGSGGGTRKNKGRGGKSSYILLRDNDMLLFERHGQINFACCDCGLVHNIRIDVAKNRNARMIVRRDNRRTGQRRRYLKRISAERILKNKEK